MYGSWSGRGSSSSRSTLDRASSRMTVTRVVMVAVSIYPTGSVAGPGVGLRLSQSFSEVQDLCPSWLFPSLNPVPSRAAPPTPVISNSGDLIWVTGHMDTGVL